MLAVILIILQTSYKLQLIWS